MAKKPSSFFKPIGVIRLKSKIIITLAPMPTQLRLQLRRLLKNAQGIEVVSQAFSWEQLQAIIKNEKQTCLILDETTLPNQQFLDALCTDLNKALILSPSPHALPARPISHQKIQWIVRPENLESETHESAFTKALILEISGSAHANRPVATRANPLPLHRMPATGIENLKRAARLDVLAIGCSTGGPTALQTLLKPLAGNVRVPIVITQHMGEGFTAALARSIRDGCCIPAKEAEEGDLLRPGHVYLAPAGKHLKIYQLGHDLYCRLDNGPPQCFCKPSVDVMLESLAEIPGLQTLVVILTGMGQDGLIGSGKIKARGGTILAQDQASAVVWGMPGAVANAQLCEAILPLDQLASAILKVCGNDTLHG